MKLWSLNSLLFIKEPHQLTKFTIFGRERPVFSDLGYSSGHVLSKTKSVTPIFLPFWQKYIITFLRGKFKKKSVRGTFWARTSFREKEHLFRCTQALMTRKPCAKGMRNAILKSNLNGVVQIGTFFSFR